MDLSPNDDKYWGNLGDAYRLRNAGEDHEKAKDAYARAIELVQRRLGTNPTAAYRRALLAYWQACVGKNRDAEAEIQQALALDNDSSDAQFHAALIYEMGGNRVAASEALARALEMGYPRTLASRHPDLQGLPELSPTQ